MVLSSSEIDSLISIERSTATVSVLSTLILLSSYICFSAFRTLSNTIIFLASFANLFADVASLIGGSALSKTSSPLCQTQGFLLEMFMQSDPFWSLAMAINVYLVFFCRFDQMRLKKLYPLYFGICYGLPFIPAVFCLVYKTKSKGKMYGNATLWCWIDNDWAPVRIYSYYAPIWIAILVTFTIYVRVGVEIFQKRDELRALSAGANGSGTFNSMATKHEKPFTGLRTTEVEVTHNIEDNPIRSLPRTYNRPEDGQRGGKNYSITISAHDHQAHPGHRLGFFSSSINSIDKVKWAYTKVALLFAASILITWVPASINRVYGLRYPTEPSYVLNVMSAIVLPLQGFWNAIIYFSTSLNICRSVWADWQAKRARRRNGGVVLGEGFKLREVVTLGGGRREKESDSTVGINSTSSRNHSMVGRDSY